MRKTAAVLGFVAFSGTACVPVRDNPLDPAVRADARIVTRVDGIEASISGRGHTWSFDASTSDSPKASIVGWIWEVSDHATTDPTDETIQWMVVGSAEVIVSVQPTAGTAVFSPELRTALLDIDDFGLEGEGVTTRFVRLEVTDGEGSRDRTTALITIENNAPEISLGPDLRVSPGGEWWNLAVGADIFGAAKHLETLTLDIRDVDRDEAATATPLAPARWRVFGALALTLDADGDSIVDDEHFGADLGHRSLTFAAPLSPSRNVFEVDASDLGDVDAGAPANAATTIHVDVLSNPWVYDRVAATFTRPDTSMFSVPLSANTEPLAVDGTRALLAEQGASKLNLRVVDQTLRDVRRLNTVGFDAMFYVNAASDGADGWWVSQGGAGGDMGTLRHYSPLNQNMLVLDRTVTSVEGTATSDFLLGGPLTMVPTLDGSKDVWIFGQTDGAGPVRLYRISVAGVLVVAQVAPATSAVSDGDGGLWMGSANAGSPHVSHLDGSGTSVLEFDLPGDGFAPRLAYDAGRGLLWMTYRFGNSAFLAYRAADGTILTTQIQNDPAQLEADTSDGTVFVQNAQPVFTRFGITEDGTSVEVRETVIPGQFLLSKPVVIQGGSVLVVTKDAFGANDRLTWLEAATSSPSFTFDIAAAPIESAALRFAVDPRTGFLWVFRPVNGRAEIYSPAGELVRFVQVTAPSTALGSGALTLDPETRTAWVIWEREGDGRLSSFPMDDLDPVVLDAPGVTIVAASDVEVAPGGDVCILNGATAFTYDPSIELSSPALSLPFGFGSVAVDVPSGEPWFFSGDAVVRMSGGSPTTFTAPTNPATGSVLIRRASPGVAPWNGIAYTPDTHFFGGSTTGWLTRFGPTTAGIAAVSPTLTAGLPNAFVVEPTAVLADPFYRHLWISFGDTAISSPGSPPLGTVLRLDQNLVEVGRESGFLIPILHGM